MVINIPNLSDKHKFWFYARKGLFQVALPILLALITLWNYMRQESGPAYDHLYFYTMGILFMYGGMRSVLNYIFDICAEEVIFKKEINLNQTTPELQFSANSMTSLVAGHHIVTIKKIFKLRYSSSKFFEYVVKTCWYLGIDCPILIPDDVVKTLNQANESENEELCLHNTLINLYKYHPTLYQVTPVININDDMTIGNSMAGSSKQLITHIDRSICQIQKELFNKETELDVDSVNANDANGVENYKINHMDDIV